jgi:hypothetical protein
MSAPHIAGETPDLFLKRQPSNEPARPETGDSQRCRIQEQLFMTPPGHLFYRRRDHFLHFLDARFNIEFLRDTRMGCRQESIWNKYLGDIELRWDRRPEGRAKGCAMLLARR